MMKKITKLITFFLILFTIAGCYAPAANEPGLSEASTKTSETFSDALPSQETSTPEAPISTPLSLTEPLLDEATDRKLSSDNVNQWQLLKTMGMNPVRDFALSPSNDELAYSNAAGVFIYDRATGKSQPYDYGKYSWAFRNDDTTANVAYSPDGKYFVIANSRILLSQTQSNEKTILLPDKLRYKLPPFRIEFSPDSKHLVIYTSSIEPRCDGPSISISLIDIQSDIVLYDQLFCSQSSLYYHFFTDDGNVVFVGRIPNPTDWYTPYTAIKVDINTGEELIFFQPKDLEGNLFSVSHDFSYIVDQPFSSRDNTRALSFPSEELLRTFPKKIFHLNQTDYILGQVEHDDQRVFTILDQDFKEQCQIKENLGFSLDVYGGPFKITNQYLAAYHKGNQEIGIWNLDDCSLDWSVPVQTFGWHNIKLSADGNKLFLQTYESFYVIDFETGNTIFRKPYTPGFSNANYAEDELNDQLFLRTGRNTIEVLDINNGETLKTYKIEYNKFISDVLFSSDLKTAIFDTFEDELWHYWDLESASEVHRWRPLAVWDIHFSKERDKLAFFNDVELTICDPLTWKECDEYPHFFGFRPVEFSQNFELVLYQRSSRNVPLRAGETGKELTVLNLASGDKLSLDTFPEFLPESTSKLVKARFSPDLNLLAAIFSNSELETYQLRVWDLETGKPLQQINLPEGSLDFLFTPNGENLIFLANGIIYVIGLPEK
jgi:hypothetical protein